MTKQLSKTYNPKEVEDSVSKKWAQSNAFHAEAQAAGEPYSIVIPPPNVTAPLHLGHALNNTLQDILVRYHRMLGDNTMWMPGTDHAGIATQTVVDKRLKQEGKPALADYKKMELSGANGRRQFIEKVQDWKDEYEKRITEQLKTMGCSCDWDRQRFTMDEQCAQAVREAFFQLFKDGLIYRGKRLVNWDPVSQTALADDEVEMHEVEGSFWYLKYPIVDDDEKETGAFVVVATTRPETMLGDTAVAVNPKDEKNAHFIGKKVKLPIAGRIIPVIGDEYVTIADKNSDDPKAQYASGFLKVTPAHDPNDWEIGRRHNLDVINIMAPDASISDQHGWSDVSTEAQQFIGLSREQARDKIVDWFKQNNLLAKVKLYTHSVGHSYRSHAAIEPYLSDQWYVKVTDDRLAGAALRALEAPPGDEKNNSGAHAFSGGAGALSGGAGVSPAIAEGEKNSNSKVKTGQFSMHRHRLPHWQVGGRIYFVTFRVQKGILSSEEKQLVLNSCMHWDGERVIVYLVTVMPDHVHILLKPLKKDENNWYELQDIVHSIKSFTSHQINQKRSAEGSIWQDEYFDRIVRDDEEFNEKFQYMLGNPVKAGLVHRPEDYPFVMRGRAAMEVEGGQNSPVTHIDTESALQADGGRDARPTLNDPPTINACPTINARPAKDSRPTKSKSRLVKTGLTFTPSRYAKTFQNWHENIRDWCISRQLWWGHRIPVWSHASGAADNVLIEQLKNLDNVAIAQANSEAPLYICLLEDDKQIISKLKAAGFKQDPDVLDTWFSSALWPLSTLGWPEDTKELETWNPTSVLCTAREIITLWVSRMVMFNIYFRDCLPFSDVFIHAMIQDGHGQKMSKSLGNGVDPMDIIYSHGADSMRFTLASMTTHTQDVRMPVDMVCPYTNERFMPKYITSNQGYKVAAPVQEAPDGSGRKMVSSYGYVSGLAQVSDEMPLARNTSKEFDIGQRFANKLWNAARFALSNLETFGSEISSSNENINDNLAGRWILSRLAYTLDSINSAIDNYRIANYTELLYDFFRRDLCDWYIEAVKPTIKQNSRQRAVLATCLDATFRMLHPVMPFVTEQLWGNLNEVFPLRGEQAGLEGIHLPAGKILILADWPKVDSQAGYENKQVEDDFSFVQKVVGAIREVRALHKIAPGKKLSVTIKASGSEAEILQANLTLIETLAGLDKLNSAADIEKPSDAAATVLGDIEIFVHGVVDKEAEKALLQKRSEELEKSIKTLGGRLNNANYLNKAPANLVQQTRDQLAKVEKEYEALQAQANV